MKPKSIEEVIRNKEFWDKTFDKMTSKQGFTDKDNTELWIIKEYERESIINELLTGKYKWSIPRKVEIAKHENSKKRVVYVYNNKDRYILGVIYRALSYLYRDDIAYNCFSYKIGENTRHAIDYIQDSLSSKQYCGVKLDIHAYFNSVNKQKLKDMINELFIGGFKVTMSNLLLTDRVMWRGTEIEEYKSLIPGCAFGSFLANWCLRNIDEQFIKNENIYARYSDDIVILDETREKVQEHIDYILNNIAEYGLIMNENKYQWFEPGNSIEFLGLKLDDNGTIDISDHAKHKIKKQIHRWCKKGRIEIERYNKDFNEIAVKVIKQINNKNLFCAISNDTTFGWAMYAFPRITTVESLKEIDEYTKDTIRAMKTGKHNKANYRKMTEDEFHSIGWISLTQMYYLYKRDYDYFMEVIELNRNYRPAL